MTDLEKKVMRRVRTIYVLRLIASPMMFSALLLAVGLWGIGREVWVERVFANGPQDLMGSLNYLAYAFSHTRFVVQALSIVSLGAMVYLARETARLFAESLSFARA